MATLVLSNHIASIETGLHTAGKPVIVCLTTQHAALRGAAWQQRPYEVITISSWQSTADLDAVADRVDGRVEHIATRWEGAVIAAGYLRDRLGLPGQTMREAIGFVDKAVQKDRLKAAKVPIARHIVVRSVADVDTAADAVGGWPVVIKPRKGFASTNIHVVMSHRELAELAADGLFETHIEASAYYLGEPAFTGLATQDDGFLVEEFVAVHREYHCDGLWVNGRPVYNIPGRYHTPPLQGMGGMLGSVLLDPHSSEGRDVVALAERAAIALGIGTGFTHAEILRTADDRWLLGEIAARPGGGGIQPAIKFGWGIDVTTAQAAVACGQTPTMAITRHPGVVGWAGPHVPPGRVVQIAAREKLLGWPGVLDATVAVQVGQMGGRTGSGLWGGLAGYVYLHGDTPEQVLGMMREATDRYQVRVERPVAATR